MLLYNGCRISEFLDLKKENVHLEEQYFDVIASKTENGLRKVPIPDKLLPFYQEWYDRHPECEYLLSTPDGKHFLYKSPLFKHTIPMWNGCEIALFLFSYIGVLSTSIGGFIRFFWY